MKTLSLTVAALALCALPLSAQSLSGRCSPNPANVGQTVTVALDTYDSMPIQLVSGCGLNAVRQGSPTGPIVYQPFICPLWIIYVSPGGMGPNVGWPGTDNRGNPVAPGLYFIEVQGFDQNGRRVTDHFPVRMDDPSAPSQDAVLSVSGSTAPGDLPFVDLAQPNEPFAAYILGASMDTNVGQTIAGLPIALDNDFLFNLSVPVADPSLFGGFSGTLDGTGSAQAVVAIPNLPGLGGYQLSLQGVILGVGGLQVSNPATCIIR